MPTRFAVSFSRKAEDDLEQIWKFIAADNPSDASSFILRLEKQIDKLERFPQRCSLISENELLGACYRHLIHGNYRTIFRVSGRTVYIVRIIHAARLLDSSSLY